MITTHDLIDIEAYIRSRFDDLIESEILSDDYY